MAESYPIAERIAQAIAAAVSTVTVANDYHQDLQLLADGTRCHRAKTAGDYARTPPGQYAAQLVAAAPERNAEADNEGPVPSLGWLQTFHVDLMYRPSDAASNPVERVLAWLWADCVKAVMADPQMGDLAETTDVDSPLFEVPVDSNEFYATAVFIVQYRTAENDPYSQ